MHGRSWYVVRGLVRAVVWLTLGVAFLLLVQAAVWLAWVGLG